MLNTQKVAYESITPTLGKRQHEVLNVITRRDKGLTAWEVSEILGWMIHVTRPRITELFKSGHIEPNGTKLYQKTGRSEVVWVLKRDFGELFK